MTHSLPFRALLAGAFLATISLHWSCSESTTTGSSITESTPADVPADTAATPSSSAGEPTADDLQILWITPNLPGPYKLQLDGVTISNVLLTEFLTPDWNTFYLSLPDDLNAISPERLSELTIEFYADPAALFSPLIRDLLLVRRHEGSHPELNHDAFHHFQEEFEADAGEAGSILLKRLGAEELNAHLERRFRLGQMMLEFNAEMPNLTEQDVVDYFEIRKVKVRAEMLASGNLSAEKIDEMLTLDDPRLHEMMHSQLLMERTEQAVDQWLLSIADDTEVVFTGPSGKAVQIPVQARL